MFLLLFLLKSCPTKGVAEREKRRICTAEANFRIIKAEKFNYKTAIRWDPENRAKVFSCFPTKNLNILSIYDEFGASSK